MNQQPSQILARALQHPVRRQIIDELAKLPVDATLSPAAFATNTGAPLGVASYHFRELLASDLVALERCSHQRGAVQHHYALSEQARDARAVSAGEADPPDGLRAARGHRSTEDRVLQSIAVADWVTGHELLALHGSMSPSVIHAARTLVSAGKAVSSDAGAAPDAEQSFRLAEALEPSRRLLAAGVTVRVIAALSVPYTAQILDELATWPAGASVDALVKRLLISDATVFSRLKHLRNLGVVEEPTAGTWTLVPAARAFVPVLAQAQ